MKILILIILSCLSQNLLASKMYSSIHFNSETGISKNLIIECNQDESLCQKTCDNKLKCVVAESLCMDCASEKSHEMNSIYAHPADEYFQSTKTNVSDDIFSYFLRNKKIMTISNDLFLNYYSPELSEKISVIFNNICGNNSNNNMMVAEINENSNNIESLPGIICIDSDKNAQIQALIFNPKYSLQKNEFWQALSSESEVALKRMGLRLRLSNKLSLP